MKRYNPKEIEPKWQQQWEEGEIYKVDFDSSKPKYIGFGMFNYPSGAGIHVGHVRNFTIPDVVTRVKRQQGYESYQPVGWDSFGLPAENFAIKTGVSPQQSTKKAIEKYHQQYRAMGWGMDWSKEINTTDPDYYKWTQWCFVKLFENGLAYQKESAQWWCEHDKTVLADEQVESGNCWRCGNPVVKKNLEQWFFKITEYADELLDATDDLTWTESVKSSQKAWIGRSVGAEIEFRLSNFECRSYIMGQKDISKEDIEAIGGRVVKTTGSGHLCVTFPRESAGQFEDLIAEKMEPGFWNEYIGDEVVFIFKDKAGRVSRYVRNEEDEAELLRLCNEYAKTNFTDIGAMLAANEWYAEILPNSKFQTPNSITVFTTRPDTLFGATFMVLAPEHPLVEKITIDSQKAEVAAYKEATIAKSEVQRQQDADKEKTGVFTGSYAINPATKEKIPIWIADYVLMGYGTGAIMAVPAHDERDHDFAQKFGIDIKQVVARHFDLGIKDGAEMISRDVVDLIIEHPNNGTFLLERETDSDEPDHVHFVGGGNDGEKDEVAIARELQEETGFKNFEIVSFVTSSTYIAYRHTKDKNQQGKSNIYHIKLKDLDQVSSELDEGRHTVEWRKKEEVADLITWSTHLDGWDTFLNGDINSEEGVLINSGKYDGVSSSEAREKIVADLAEQGVAREKVNYKMRDWLISRQRYWGAPIPIVHCEKDGAVVLPEDQLPLVLPEVDNYMPTGENTSALANAPDWVNTTCPKCGGPARRETDTMDGYVCSSWYFLRYLDPSNADKPFSEDRASKWAPIDFYNGGDHATAHLLYARFFNRFFQKIGLVEAYEPFKKMLFNGKIKASDGSAFSKSKGNGIDPLEVIEQGYGADSIRLYQMFAAPLELDVLWDQQGIPGAYRFISRVWTLVQMYLDSDKAELPEDHKKAILSPIHKSIKKVTEELEEFRFNTAIAGLMEAVNSLYKAKESYGLSQNDTWQFALESVLQLLAPFAPHASEELWHSLGNEDSIHVDHWPKWEDTYLVSDIMKIVVQVNGKVRATVEVAAGSSQKEILQAAKANEKVASYLGKSSIKKEIYVPGRLVNLVV